MPLKSKVKFDYWGGYKRLSSFFLIYLSDSLKISLIWMTIEIWKFEYKHLQNLLMLSGQPLSKSGFGLEIFRSEP